MVFLLFYSILRYFANFFCINISSKQERFLLYHLFFSTDFVYEGLKERLGGPLQFFQFTGFYGFTVSLILFMRLCIHEIRLQIWEDAFLNILKYLDSSIIQVAGVEIGRPAGSPDAGQNPFQMNLAFSDNTFQRCVHKRLPIPFS